VTAPLSELAQKLRRLAARQDYDAVVDLLDDAASGFIYCGICLNAGCDRTSPLKDNEEVRLCCTCGTLTVESATALANRLRLAGQRVPY
jgi:hypothetical protein